jgi:hypothetical protein
MADKSQKFREIIARVWKDEAFKQKLLSDPKKTLADEGIDFPADVRLKVHMDTADSVNIVIPRNPAESQLSDEALSNIAGGSSGDTVCNTTCQDWCT